MPFSLGIFSVILSKNFYRHVGTLSHTGEDHVNISNKKSLFLKNYIKPVSLKASSMHADIIPCLKPIYAGTPPCIIPVN